ncbi:hypothetical protein I203_105634 [Kwoniella mangroviensis CBS 8507]|uniref:uncharacterized protein n=1 Tax=Kwoniella mangroviensis CBS 8507 TaxID=1296122 RepID=UPI00080D0D86|nr:uncharacterized protein I203_01448 [Kwoniella mangroviensis CBS 8507]OCF69584.1 hypothetical protein I203_01448 [Kwoniella mangroviensis CBS 8507]
MTDSTTSRQRPGSTPAAPKVSNPYTHSRFGTLFSRQLPNYTGIYPVGVLDVEFPIEPQTIGSFRHKKLHTAGQAGIEIDTVLFSLFYPCDLESGSKETKGTVWFPRASPTVNGFLKMAGIENSLIRALAYAGALSAVHGLKFPSHQRAPILPHPSNDKWPLIIFSHGVGCSRLMYTHICGELASRGCIVAAVEHRDGTGPSAKITSEDGKERDVDFLRWTDIDWPDRPEDQQPKDDNTLRHDQLKIRMVEMESAIEIIRKITEGSLGDSKCHLLASRTVDWNKWKGQVEVGDGKVCLAGHSFGGSAVIAAAANPRFKPHSIIALDPAIERLEPWNSTIPCPMLSVNSEEFVLSEDYQRLIRVSRTVQNDNRHVFAIAGTTHPAFSDVFLITPGFVGSMTGLSVPPYSVFPTTVQAIEAFLDSNAEAGNFKLDSLGSPVEVMLSKPIGEPGELLRQILAA